MEITKGWWDSFRRGHPEISLRHAEPLSYARAVANNPNVIENYFELLAETIETNGLTRRPGQIFNFRCAICALLYPKERDCTTHTSTRSLSPGYYVFSFPTNPKASSMSQGVLATILQWPTPPAQKKVHTHQQGARVLTSELCIQQLEEKEVIKEKQEEKERRKAKCERKRQEKVKASKVKKTAKNKGTAQSSKTACSAYT